MKKFLFIFILLAVIPANIYALAGVQFGIGGKLWYSFYNLGDQFIEGYDYYDSIEDYYNDNPDSYPIESGLMYGPHAMVKLMSFSVAVQYLMGSWDFGHMYVGNPQEGLYEFSLELDRSELNVMVGYSLINVSNLSLGVFGGYKNISFEYTFEDNTAELDGNGIGGGVNASIPIWTNARLSASGSYLNFSGDLEGDAIYLEGGIDYFASPFVIGLKLRDEIYDESQYIMGGVLSISFLIR